MYHVTELTNKIYDQPRSVISSDQPITGYRVLLFLYGLVALFDFALCFGHEVHVNLLTSLFLMKIQNE
jgi:hypothetical protein